MKNKIEKLLKELDELEKVINDGFAAPEKVFPSLSRAYLIQKEIIEILQKKNEVKDEDKDNISTATYTCPICHVSKEIYLKNDYRMVVCECRYTLFIRRDEKDKNKLIIEVG